MAKKITTDAVIDALLVEGISDGGLTTTTLALLVPDAEWKRIGCRTKAQRQAYVRAVEIDCYSHYSTED